jgi:tight adherence protein C
MEWVDQVQYWYNGLRQDEALLRLLITLLLGLLAFVVSIAVAQLIGRSVDPVKRRISSYVTEPSAKDDDGSHAQRLMERLGRGLTPRDPEKRGRTETRLIQAGFRSPLAIDYYYAAKIIAMLLLPAAILMFVLVSGIMPLRAAVGFIGLGLPMGLLLPDVWLVRRVRHRQTILRRSLPDALDMLVVCSEAGLGLNAAIQRVAQEIEFQHPELADELGMVMMQMRAGMEARVALRDLVERTGMEEIRALVATLLQAMRFGTSIADTLRNFADDIRDRRLKAAEEEAAKVAVKMIIPIALFMLPAFMLVSMAPPLLRMARSLSGD